MVDLAQIGYENIEAFLPMIPPTLQRESIEDGEWRFMGIADDEAVAVGVIILRTEAQSAIIKYIYIVPESRNTGYINDAFSQLVFGLHDEGFVRLRMDYVPSEYPAISYLSKRFSFKENKTDKSYFRFCVSDVRRCLAASYAPKGVMRLKALPPALKNILFNKVKEKGYDISQFGDNVMELSLVYMVNERPMGLLLVESLKDLRSGGRSGSIGVVFPESSSADISLIYISTGEMKAPLYLLSALCRNILKDFEDNDVITGYFDEGHMTRLLEGTLNIRGKREVMAVLSLDEIEQIVDIEDELLFNL
ncbi:MAG: hypothetical protein K6G12_02395 [Lachnospiraceae bacterium]|nr:hypothetical protein [Lachnospiraceae bacterium]